MNTVAIVGVGLIGASFGLALREAGFGGTIIGVSSAPATADAKRVGAIHDSAPLKEACAAADLIYLSQTVDRILSTLPLLGPLARPNALVTDAGSTKVTIVRQAQKYLTQTMFVGGHPLAGKETRGATAAEGSLFRGRPYVLTRPLGPTTPHLQTLRLYLERMGARIVEMTAEAHDEATAFTSHLPQLLSTALAGMLGCQSNAAYLQVHGPGLLDMTRLAMSSPDLWEAILKNNRANVLAALDHFSERLAAVKEAVSSNDIHRLFTEGGLFARSLRATRDTGEVSTERD